MNRYVVELGGRTFAVRLEGGMASVDGGPPVPAHLEAVDGTPVRLVTLGTTVHRVTTRRDGARGRYVLRVDGRRYEVDALDERTRAIRDLAEANRPPAGPVPLLAPMPGLVVRVHVAAGDGVDPGAPLVSVEAMKMENELRAVAAGTVRRVLVAKGTAVEKGAVLVEFD
ncbi:MAG: biotin/lipoyl-containing protein [Gemmatimonadota bacterium]|nr:biotin/lipoyl-containing protein [Gemmatimonadota bacterium]